MSKNSQYLTAKAAEFIADEAIIAFNKRDGEAELKDVLDVITTNAIARRKRAYIHQELLPSTVQTLRDLGYEVKEPTNEEWEGPQSYRISWNNKAARA